MSRTPNNSINWEALKAEFISGEETLNQFRIRKKLNKKWFYHKAETWPEDRGRIRERALKKVEKKLEEYYANFIEDTKALLTCINHHFKHQMSDSLAVGEDGKVSIKIDMAPEELKRISESLSVNLKTVRLLSEKSTENLATKNYHTAIVQMLNDHPAE